MSFELVGVRLVAENGPQYFSTMNAADKAVVDYGRSASRTFKQMPGLADIATGAFHRIGAAAIDFAAQGARAIGGFFKDSITQAADFQDGMLEFQSVAGKDVDTAGLTKFHDLFLQLGQDLPVSTAEVQQAAIEMVKGGIDPATVAAGGLKQNIQFAAAAMKGDLAGAAEISAKVLGGWASATATAQEKADFLTHSTDLLTKAANASSVDVKELSLGIFNAQGIAKTAGVSFDDLTTTLAELAPRFASSSEAGTSLKNLIARLQPTTKPAIAAMQGLGLITADGANKFYDLQGNFVGFSKASQLLQDSLKGLTKQQQASILQTVFGNDAMSAASALAELGSQGYDAMATSLAKANGVVESSALKQQSLSTAWANFQGTIEKVQIQIGEALIPTLSDLFTNTLQPGITAVSEFANSIFSAQDPIAALITSVDSVLPGFQGFADFLGVAVPQAIDFLMEHLDAVEGALVAVGAVIAGAAVAGAIASLANPITAIVVAIGILGAAWAEDWGGIRTTLTDFWETTGEPIFEQVSAWLSKEIPKAIKVASDFWLGTLQPALSEVWAFISTKVIPIINTLVTVYFKAVEIELKILASFWTGTLLPAIKDVWGFLDKYVVPIFQAVARVEIAALKLAIRELTDIWNDVLLPAITAVYDFFKDNIIPIFSDTDDGGSDLARSIRDTLGPAFTWLTDNVLKPVNEWFGKIGDAISGAIDWLNRLADTINSLPSLPDPFVGHSPPPIATWMSSIAVAAEHAASAISAATEAVANAPSSAPSWLSGGGLGGGISHGGGVIGRGDLFSGGTSRGIASAGTLMARGAGTMNATYNQQRTTNLTYHTTHAPPVNHSMAVASALAGGS